MAKEKERKFQVVFTAISDAKSELRYKDEILTAAEVGDVDRQLEIGSISEIASDEPQPQPQP